MARSLGHRVSRPAGPGSDECHTWDGVFRPFHRGLDSFQESVHIAQAFKRKIELLHLRQQGAKKIVDPQRGCGIISHGNFHPQSWCGQARLLKGTI